MTRNLVFVAAVGCGLVFALATQVHAIPPGNFAEFNTVVNGYQDEFDSATRNPDWLVFGPAGDVYDQPGDGFLHVGRPPHTGDPNKLLYNPPGGYDTTNQNVLALITLDALGTNDAARGGIHVGSNTGDGQGFNLHFRAPGQQGNGNHFNLLDDLRAWGPATPGPNDWELDTPYWLRLTTDGSQVVGTVWPADGVTPESSAMKMEWARGDRAGLAGISAASIDGTLEMRVDYILIQADGLPATLIGIPEPSSIVLTGLGLAGLMACAWRRRKRRIS